MGINKLFNIINLKKITAVTVINCFLFSFICSPAISEVMANINAAEQYKQIFKDFVLPYSCGKITKAHYAATDRVVINIQDLHCHPKVQKNISNIIDIFDKQYGVNNIYLEGAYGDVDTSWLTEKIEQNEKNIILDKLIETGKLTGVEYYSALYGRTGIIKGLEEKEPYLDNLKRFGSILESQNDINTILKGVEESTKELKNKYYTKRQYKIEQLSKEYLAGKIKPEKYYILLSKHIDRLGIDLSKYENTLAYVMLLELQKELNYPKITEELQNFVILLKGQLPYGAYKMLLDSTKNFTQTDKLYEYIVKISKIYNLDLSINFKELNKYFNYVELSKKINPLELITEEENLTKEINTRFSETKAQRDVVFITHFEKYLKDYLLSKITADDYEYYKANIKQYKELWNKYVDNRVLGLLEEYLKEADKFYEINNDRNKYFTEKIFNGAEPAKIDGIKGSDRDINNIIENMKKVKRVDVVLTGGFHSGTVGKILEKQGVSYIVITPNVTGGAKEAEKTYYEIAKEQKRILFQTLATLPLSLYGQETRIRTSIKSFGEDIAKKIFGVEAVNTVLNKYNDDSDTDIEEMAAKVNERQVQIAKLLNSDDKEGIIEIIKNAVRQDLKEKITEEFLEKIDFEKLVLDNTEELNKITELLSEHNKLKQSLQAVFDEIEKIAAYIEKNIGLQAGIISAVKEIQTAKRTSINNNNNSSELDETLKTEDDTTDKLDKTQTLDTGEDKAIADESEIEDVSFSFNHEVLSEEQETEQIKKDLNGAEYEIFYLDEGLTEAQIKEKLALAISAGKYLVIYPYRKNTLPVSSRSLFNLYSNIHFMSFIKNIFPDTLGISGTKYLDINNVEHFTFRYLVKEIVKNAFVHGNKLNFTKPVYLKFNVGQDGILSAVVLNRVSDETANKDELFLAKQAGLHGEGLGKKQAQENAAYSEMQKNGLFTIELKNIYGKRFSGIEEFADEIIGFNDSDKYFVRKAGINRQFESSEELYKYISDNEKELLKKMTGEEITEGSFLYNFYMKLKISNLSAAQQLLVLKAVSEYQKETGPGKDLNKIFNDSKIIQLINSMFPSGISDIVTDSAENTDEDKTERVDDSDETLNQIEQNINYDMIQTTEDIKKLLKLSEIILENYFSDFDLININMAKKDMSYLLNFMVKNSSDQEIYNKIISVSCVLMEQRGNLWHFLSFIKNFETNIKDDKKEKSLIKILSSLVDKELNQYDVFDFVNQLSKNVADLDEWDKMFEFLGVEYIPLIMHLVSCGWLKTFEELNDVVFFASELDRVYNNKKSNLYSIEALSKQEFDDLYNLVMNTKNKSVESMIKVFCKYLDKSGSVKDAFNFINNLKDKNIDIAEFDNLLENLDAEYILPLNDLLVNGTIQTKDDMNKVCEILSYIQANLSYSRDLNKDCVKNLSKEKTEYILNLIKSGKFTVSEKTFDTGKDTAYIAGILLRITDFNEAKNIVFDFYNMKFPLSLINGRFDGGQIIKIHRLLKENPRVKKYCTDILNLLGRHSGQLWGDNNYIDKLDSFFRNNIVFERIKRDQKRMNDLIKALNEAGIEKLALEFNGLVLFVFFDKNFKRIIKEYIKKNSKDFDYLQNDILKVYRLAVDVSRKIAEDSLHGEKAPDMSSEDIENKIVTATKEVLDILEQNMSNVLIDDNTRVIAVANSEILTNTYWVPSQDVGKRRFTFDGLNYLLNKVKSKRNPQLETLIEAQQGSENEAKNIFLNTIRNLSSKDSSVFIKFIGHGHTRGFGLVGNTSDVIISVEEMAESIFNAYLNGLSPDKIFIELSCCMSYFSPRNLYECLTKKISEYNAGNEIKLEFRYPAIFGSAGYETEYGYTVQPTGEYKFFHANEEEGLFDELNKRAAGTAAPLTVSDIVKSRILQSNSTFYIFNFSGDLQETAETGQTKKITKHEPLFFKKAAEFLYNFKQILKIIFGPVNDILKIVQRVSISTFIPVSAAGPETAADTEQQTDTEYFTKKSLPADVMELAQDNLFKLRIFNKEIKIKNRLIRMVISVFLAPLIERKEINKIFSGLESEEDFLQKHHDYLYGDEQTKQEYRQRLSAILYSMSEVNKITGLKFILNLTNIIVHSRLNLDAVKNDKTILTESRNKKVSENKSVRNIFDNILSDIKNVVNSAKFTQDTVVKIISSEQDIEELKANKINIENTWVIADTIIEAQNLRQQGINAAAVRISKERGGVYIDKYPGTNSVVRAKWNADKTEIIFCIKDDIAAEEEILKQCLAKEQENGNRNKFFAGIENFIIPAEATKDEVINEIKNKHTDGLAAADTEIKEDLTDTAVKNMERTCSEENKTTGAKTFIISLQQARQYKEAINKMQAEGYKYIVSIVCNNADDIDESLLNGKINGLKVDASSVQDIKVTEKILEKLKEIKLSNGIDTDMSVLFPQNVIANLADADIYDKYGIMPVYLINTMHDIVSAVKAAGKKEAELKEKSEDEDKADIAVKDIFENIFRDNNIVGITINEKNQKAKEFLAQNKDGIKKLENKGQKSAKSYNRGYNAALSSKFNYTATDIKVLAGLLSTDIMSVSHEEIAEKLYEITDILSSDAQSYLQYLSDMGRYEEAAGFIRGVAANSIRNKIIAKLAAGSINIDVESFNKNIGKNFQKAFLTSALQLEIAGKDITELLNTGYAESDEMTAKEYLESIKVKTNEKLEDILKQNEYKISDIAENNAAQTIEDFRNFNILLQDRFTSVKLRPEVQISISAVKSMLSAA